MKEYIPETAEFSDSITIPETTDTNHADNINSAPKQLIANDIANKESIESLAETLGQVAGGETYTGTLSGNPSDYDEYPAGTKAILWWDTDVLPYGSGPVYKLCDESGAAIESKSLADNVPPVTLDTEGAATIGIMYPGGKKVPYTIVIIGGNTGWQEIDYNTVSESSVTETPAIRVKNGMAELKGTFNRNPSNSTPCSFPSEYAPDHEITVVKYNGDYLYTYIVGTDGGISVTYRSIESTQTSPMYVNLSGITWMLK